MWWCCRYMTQVSIRSLRRYSVLPAQHPGIPYSLSYTLAYTQVHALSCPRYHFAILWWFHFLLIKVLHSLLVFHFHLSGVTSASYFVRSSLLIARDTYGYYRRWYGDRSCRHIGPGTFLCSARLSFSLLSTLFFTLLSPSSPSFPSKPSPLHPAADHYDAVHI